MADITSPRMVEREYALSEDGFARYMICVSVFIFPSRANDGKDKAYLVFSHSPLFDCKLFFFLCLRVDFPKMLNGSQTLTGPMQCIE